MGLSEFDLSASCSLDSFSCSSNESSTSYRPGAYVPPGDYNFDHFAMDVEHSLKQYAKRKKSKMKNKDVDVNNILVPALMDFKSNLDMVLNEVLPNSKDYTINVKGSQNEMVIDVKHDGKRYKIKYEVETLE